MDTRTASSPPKVTPLKSGPPKSGRVQARRLKTRARLLEAAYELMSTQGVDATTIKEITERADTGFGTFYNYFSSKDDVAARVLDCVINALGRRNDLANEAACATNQVQIITNSLRLVAREMMSDPMWRWWVKRPDLMIERMRAGFGPFGLRDLRTGRQEGAYRIIGDDLQTAWSMVMWLLSGNIKDINDGYSPPATAAVMAESIMRMLGVPLDLAHRMSNTPLPACVAIDIDFSFMVGDER